MREADSNTDVGTFGSVGESESTTLSSRTKFVLVAQARTGSNLLMSYLDQHQNVKAFYEVFHDAESDRNDVRGRVFKNGEDPIRFLEFLYNGDDPSWVKAVGFKLFLDHCRNEDTEAVWDYLGGLEELRVLRLVRENWFDVLVSLEVAWRTGTWAMWVDKPRKSLDLPPFPISSHRCETFFKRFEKWDLQFRRSFAGRDYLLLNYRELVSDSTRVLQSVLDYLGLPSFDKDPFAKTIKQNNKLASERVSNFGELKSVFLKTKYGKFFV